MKPIPSNNVRLYQIFYNDATRQQAINDPYVIPLDNCHSERPDWFEFWVIKHFLDTHPLEDDVYYGFLSPKFTDKTTLTPQQIHQLLEPNPFEQNKLYDVYLAGGAMALTQMAYFTNSFEQGEFWHKGLFSLSQRAFDEMNWQMDLKEFIYHTGNFVFCNYVVATKKYWQEWKKLADDLFNLCEQNTPLAQELNAETTHTRNNIYYSMKVFIQERLPELVLKQNQFRIASLENWSLEKDELTAQIMHYAFVCNQLKARFCLDRNSQHIHAFNHLRQFLFKCNMSDLLNQQEFSSINVNALLQDI